MTISGLRDARTGQEITGASSPPEAGWSTVWTSPHHHCASVLLDPHVPMAEAALRQERSTSNGGDGFADLRCHRLVPPASVRRRGLLDGDQAGRFPGPARPSRQAKPGRWSPLACPCMATSSTPETMPRWARSPSSCRSDITVQAADEPFGIGGHSYERGTLLVRREGNADDLDRRLEVVAERWGVTFRATPTADSEQGSDLGGSHFDTLRLPRVGIISGMPISHDGLRVALVCPRRKGRSAL